MSFTRVRPGQSLLDSAPAIDAARAAVGDRTRDAHGSAREPFDHLLLIDSGLLTHDEIDRLRPRVYEALARGAEDDEYD